MKTITIPKRFGYPTTEISVNGEKHTLKSGVEITVEDYVAEVIENALALEPKAKRYISKFAQLVGGSLSEVIAEDLEGIEAIGSSAFKNCNALTSVVIPKTVKAIGLSAFSGCTSLKDISIPNGVESIGNYAFYNCNNITSMELPNSVTNIGTEVFYGCIKLERIVIPELPPVLANVNAFPDIKPSCTFYCKSQESLEAYKKAANWSTLTGTYSFVVEH